LRSCAVAALLAVMRVRRWCVLDDDREGTDAMRVELLYQPLLAFSILEHADARIDEINGWLAQREQVPPGDV
jgi:hypothetical protein